MRADTRNLIRRTFGSALSFWPAFLLSMFFMALMNAFGFMDRILDARFYYTGPEASEYLRSLSDTDRLAYLRQEYLDLGFIVSYSASLYFLMRKVLRPRTDSNRLWLAFVPGFLDLGETLGIIYLLKWHVVTEPDWLGILTGLKWTSGALLAFYLITVKLQDNFRHRSLRE